MAEWQRRSCSARPPAVKFRSPSLSDREDHRRGCGPLDKLCTPARDRDGSRPGRRRGEPSTRVSARPGNEGSMEAFGVATSH